MSDCIFCKIIAGEIPSRKIYEDERCYAFHDIDPKAPVHFLVIPKEHITGANRIVEENAPLVGHIFAVIAKVAAELGAATTTASSPTAAPRLARRSATCISTCWRAAI